MSYRPLAASATDSDSDKDGFPSSPGFPPSSRHARSASGNWAARASHVQRLARTYPLPTVALAILSLTLVVHLLSPTRQPPPDFSSRPTHKQPYDLDSLPLYAYPNGTRYPHPLRPSDDPWPRRPVISDHYLAQSRLDRELNQLQEYDLLVDYVQATEVVLSAVHRDGSDEKGRPRKIPHAALYDGKEQGWAPKKLGAPVELPPVQHASMQKDGRSTEEKEQDELRRGWVVKAFKHLWGHYVESAWGYDELKPLSQGASNPFAGWGATIFDALDTLLIMGLKDEYLRARAHVAQVDFSFLAPSNPDAYPRPNASLVPPMSVFMSTAEPDSVDWRVRSPRTVRTFETIIRYLGSLLSAYDLTADPLMLSRAVELGDFLLPSMATRTGFIEPAYELGTHGHGGEVGTVCLAEIGSVALEFARLSQVTGDPVYLEAVQRGLDTLDTWPAADRLKGLFPVWLNTRNQSSLTGTYTFGGQADSYYEYLIKLYQLLGGSSLSPSSSSSSSDAASQYARMYTAAIDSAQQHLVRPITTVPGLEGAATIGDVHYKETYKGEVRSWFSMRLDHLTCFAGGMLGLGSRLLGRDQDFDTAQKFTKACTWAYDSTRTGLAPEGMELWAEGNPERWEAVELEDGTIAKTVKGDPPGVYGTQNYHIQRPETIESVFYMYRLTGDRKYQDDAWRMFTSWVDATITEGGFTHIHDVNSANPKHDDSGVESFVYGETLKYYYLIFSSPDLLSLDDWTFTTEAHPFRSAKPSSSSAPSTPAAPFWQDAPALTMPPLREVGQGTPAQKWVRMLQAATVKGWDTARSKRR
ncbi:hypothetical protein JCM10207_000294 [Rhodosporidiobolus poonsookiae]